MPLPSDLPRNPPTGTIPRILHQIWVGSPVPDWVAESWERWEQMHPGWTFMRWTDDNRDEWPLSDVASRHDLPHIVVLADIIRLEQVWRHGGVYADSDTIPLKPLDPMVGDRPAWLAQAGWDTTDEPKPVTLNNAVFAFPPKHPFICNVWEQAVGALDKKSPFHIAGPGRFEKVYATTPDEDRPELPPWSWFPDLPRSYARKRAVPTRDELADMFPQAYLVHTADKSWYGANHSVHQTPTFIMAVPWHPDRKQRAEELAEQTRGKIVWDTKRHAFDTFRRVLREAGTKPAIIVEDDVILADDWRNKVEKAVAEHPDDIIQFFSMRKADIEVGSRYEPGRTFLMNQCYYLPEGVAKALLDYTTTWVTDNPADPTGYDVAMARWMKEQGRKYWVHVPSLVQHEPWRSEINPRRPRNRQSSTFGAAP